MSFRSCAAVVAIASIAAPAYAAGSYYFNKPGISREIYVADVSECRELAGDPINKHKNDNKNVYVNNEKVFTVRHQNTTAGYVGLGITDAVIVALISGESRKLKRVVERTCMADKGYRRMQLDDSAVREIKMINNDRERADKFFSLAASENPLGKELTE